MAQGNVGYANQQAMLSALPAQTPTLKDRIELAVRQAEQKLADVKRARELLDKNPELEELLNIMQRMYF